MIIQSHSKNYTINFHNGYDSIPGLSHPEMFFVVDENVRRLYANEFIKKIDAEQLIVIEAAEANKTVQTALDICERFIALPSKRNSTIVSIGGGIVQDVTGFAANILYRGIRWIFIPTTLLAMCDSCIGSKTSLNYKGYKNLLGTFYPPDKINIIPDFTGTLSEVDYCSGLGEVVKFACMSGPEGLAQAEESIGALLLRDTAVLRKFIDISLHFKSSFIQEDEFDRGRRVLLNFGHTFGHAIESVSRYEVPHGLAVAYGMLVANRISSRRGIMGQALCGRIEALTLKLFEQAGLKLDAFPPEGILNAMRKDKKQTSDRLRIILLQDDLSLVLVDDANSAEVAWALEAVHTLIG